MLEEQYRQHGVAKQRPLLGLLILQAPGIKQQLCDVNSGRQHEKGVHLHQTQLHLTIADHAVCLSLYLPEMPEI